MEMFTVWNNTVKNLNSLNGWFDLNVNLFYEYKYY